MITFVDLPPPFCSTRLLGLKMQAAAAVSGARDRFLVPAVELQAKVLALELPGSEAGQGILARLTGRYLPVLVWLQSAAAGDRRREGGGGCRGCTGGTVLRCREGWQELLPGRRCWLPGRYRDWD